MIVPRYTLSSDDNAYELQPAEPFCLATDVELLEQQNAMFQSTIDSLHVENERLVTILTNITNHAY